MGTYLQTLGPLFYRFLTVTEEAGAEPILQVAFLSVAPVHSMGYSIPLQEAMAIDAFSC